MNRLNYRGDRTDYDPYQVYGPDMFGACYKPVSAEYEAQLDRTTITLRPIPPAVLRELREVVLTRALAQEAQFAAVFGIPTGEVSP